MFDLKRFVNEAWDFILSILFGFFILILVCWLFSIAFNWTIKVLGGQP